MTERLERTKRVVLRSMEPETIYTAEDLGVEKSVLEGLCRDGKITKFGRGSRKPRYMLAEDVAGEEQPDEDVPEPEEEEEEEEEEVVARPGLSDAMALWRKGSAVRVDTTHANGMRPKPKGGWDVELVPTSRSEQDIKDALAGDHLKALVAAARATAVSFEMERRLTEDDKSKTHGASWLYCSVGFDADGNLLIIYPGQKRVRLLMKRLGHYAGSAQLKCARVALFQASLTVVFPLCRVEAKVACVAEASVFETLCLVARERDIFDGPEGVIRSVPPYGGLAIFSPVVKRLILQRGRSKNNPLYDYAKTGDETLRIPASEVTTAARSAATAEMWRRMPPKKKKKEVESCVEIKFRAPHAIDNLTHWLISTQLERLRKIAKTGGAASAAKWRKKTPKEKQAAVDKASKLQGGDGTLSPSQHKQFVKLVKVNSRRDSS